MSARLLVLTVIGLAGAVLGGRNKGLGNEPKDDVTAGPMLSLKSGAAFDPEGRVFKLGITPFMVTEIHQRYVEEFIRRPGNGHGRVVPVRPSSSWTELVTDSEARRPYGSKWASPLYSRGGEPTVKYFDEVNGTMMLKDNTVRTVNERIWVVRNQDLMSVDGADGPAVYILDPHKLHELMREKKQVKGDDAKKRKPTEFETAALKKLRNGDDVVLQSSAKEMNVLGAVRARNDCLTCHQVEVGSLLGAFTYTLDLQSQETPAADRLKDTAGLSREEISAVLTIESIGGRVTRDAGGPVREVALSYLVSQAMARSYAESTRYVRIRDYSLDVLSVFPELKVLDVSHAIVTDDGLKVIAKLKKLEKLDLRGTWVTVDGLAKLKKDLPECKIRHHSTEPIRP
jgi:hypothetical protein